MLSLVGNFLYEIISKDKFFHKKLNLLNIDLYIIYKKIHFKGDFKSPFLFINFFIVFTYIY